MAEELATYQDAFDEGFSLPQGVVATSNEYITRGDFGGTYGLSPTPNELTTLDVNELVPISMLVIPAPSVSVQVTHIAVSAGRMMFPIGTYIDGMNPPPFPTTGAVYLKLLLTNSGSTNGVFGGSFQINANPTYFGSNTNKFSATLSNNTGTPISSISVPANSSVSVNIGADAVMNRNGSSIATPPLNTITATTIRVYQDAGTIATAGIKCKASAF